MKKYKTLNTTNLTPAEKDRLIEELYIDVQCLHDRAKRNTSYFWWLVLGAGLLYIFNR